MSKQFNIDIELRQIQHNMFSHLQLHWKLFVAEGVFFIFLGITAIVIPQVFTMGIALSLGWLLLAGGTAHVVRAIRMIKMSGFSLWLVSGLLQAAIGYFLVTQPVTGLMALTLSMLILFAMEGIIKTCLALMIRPLAYWGSVLFSGISSLVLAMVVWIGWPGTTIWILGLLLGINMIFLGGSLLNIGLNHKPAT